MLVAKYFCNYLLLSSMKTSKAALLMKGGDYLQQLKSDRDNLTEQGAALRRRIESLNLEVGEMLAMLPSGKYNLC
jgi:MAX-like protein X